MRGHSGKSETMGRNGQRDRNNYHSSSVCCTVIKVCQSFNDFFKVPYFLVQNIQKCSVLNFCTKEFSCNFKNHLSTNVSDAYFMSLNLNSGFYF